jgi:hypothetical protein
MAVSQVVVPPSPFARTGAVTKLRNANDQVGIGTSAPTATNKLQIDASAGGFAVAASFLNGSVGIGTAAPAAGVKLDVAGATRVQTTVQLDSQGADPVAIVTRGQVYTKTVLGVIQLFYEASDGTVSQLTPGSASVVTLQDVYDDGNTIAATAARPIAFSNAVDATDLLTLTRTFAGAGAGLSVSMGAATTGVGIFLNQATGGSGLLLQLQNNAVNKFTVNNAGDVLVAGKLTVTGAIDPPSILLSGGTALYLESNDGSTAPVSGAATGRLRYNNTTGTWQVSTQAGAYSSLSTAATSTLQQAYTNGGAGGGVILLTSAGGALALTNPAASAHAVMTLTQGTAGQNALTASGGNIDLSGGNVLVGSTFGLDTSAAGSLKIGVTTATSIDLGGVGVTALNLTATTTTITGDLTVNGTVTTINTTNLTVTDSLIYANDGAGSASAGIAWDRQATTNDAIFLWSETNSRFEIGLNNTTGGTVTPASLAIFSDVKLSSLFLAGTAITADAGLTVTATTAPLSLSATGAFAVNLQTSGVTRVEVKSDGPLEFPTNTTAAVSAATKGALRYNNTTGAFQVSASGGAWTDLATGVDTLQAAYGAGNTIAATAARPIAFSNAVDATDLLTLTRTFAGAGSAAAVSMGATTTGVGYSASMVAGSTGAAMSWSGGTSLFLESTDGSTSAVSGAATGRLRYDNGSAAWQVSTQGSPYHDLITTIQRDAVNLRFLGTRMDYPASGNMTASRVQYTRVWIERGITLNSMQIFVDGAAAGNINLGIYDQATPTSNTGTPSTLLASTGSTVVATGYMTPALTSPYTTTAAGYYWVGVVASSPAPTYAVSQTFRSGFFNGATNPALRFETSAGVTLPAGPGHTFLAAATSAIAYAAASE